MSERRTLLLIVVLSVALRVGVALYLGDTVPVGKDENSYSVLAARLATGHGYSFAVPWYPFGTPAGSPTSHWSFLYTAFVAGVYALFGPHPLGARLVQAVVAGALMPWLTWRLARRLKIEDERLKIGDLGTESSIFNSTTRRVASSIPLLAAFLSAIYAYFALYGAMVQTEAFFICALLWSLERALALGDAFASQRSVRDPGARHLASAGHLMANTSRGGEDAGRSRVTAYTAATAPTVPQSSIFNFQSSITLGLSLGVATLLRQSILPWVAVMFVWLIWTGWKVVPAKAGPRLKVVPAKAGAESTKVDLAGVLRTPVAAVLTAGIVMVACIAPFTIRNYVAYDNFLLLNSNAGYALYSAQHPAHGTSFQEYWAAPLPEELAGQGLNEAEWDDALMARGIGFVLAEPGRYLLLSLSRVRDYMEFWPTADSSLVFNVGRVLSIGVFLPFMLYGMWLAVTDGRRKKEEGRSDLQPSTSGQLRPAKLARWPNLQPFFHLRSSFFLLAFIAFYSVLHIATWAMSRYRLPVDAVALIFAAGAIAHLWGRWQSRPYVR